MNNKSLTGQKTILLLIVFLLAGSLIFAFSNTTKMVSAKTVSPAANEFSTTSFNVEETYTVNFYNGNESVGTFQISAGDSYTLTQTGYIINGVSTDFTGKSKMENCAYGAYYGSPKIEKTVVITFAGWQINDSVLSNNVI